MFALDTVTYMVSKKCPIGVKLISFGKIFHMASASTVCPISSDPFYVVYLPYKMGDYFLDTQYKIGKVRDFQAGDV